ncbi:MAG TPA: aminoacyl-tRNA deacylase [Burkholderiales bacterium]|nr:aminoacyl-tRNA deacylase [Burkholderiales bacterium]
MSSARVPSTPAVLALRAAKIAFTPHFYTYEEKGGTAVSSRELGVDEHAVVKTLVMADDKAAPLMVLLHGDMKVSTKALARVIGVKTVVPCTPEVAQRHSGYRVGGTSPFGTRKKMPVYVERSVLELPAIYINGGSRGFLVCIAPDAVVRLLGAKPVEVAIPL